MTDLIPVLTPQGAKAARNGIKTFPYDILVFIGRFQPFHNGHKAVIDQALQQAAHVIVLVGSSHLPRTIRNPFRFQERAQMIKGAYPEEFTQAGGCLHIEPLLDYTYAEQTWLANARRVVEGVATRDYHGGKNDLKVGLIGYSKDKSSYYLDRFPHWDNESVNNYLGHDATDLREPFLLDGTLPDPKHVPQSTYDFLKHWREDQSTAAILQGEMKTILSDREECAQYRWPVKKVTADAVLEMSGHILLVRRKKHPGKGLWALPGGHLNNDETLVECMIRELKEETKIKLPDRVIMGSIKGSHIFDDPYRSCMGRVVTNAYHVVLEPSAKFPRVKGSDDAEVARWVPLNEVMKMHDVLFDDHWHIINHFSSPSVYR